MLKTLPTGLHHHIKPKSVRDLQIVHSSLVSGEQYFSLVSHPEKQNFPNFVWIRRRHDLLSICWIEGRIRIALFFSCQHFQISQVNFIGLKTREATAANLYGWVQTDNQSISHFTGLVVFWIQDTVLLCFQVIQYFRSLHFQSYFGWDNFAFHGLSATVVHWEMKEAE